MGNTHKTVHKIVPLDLKEEKDQQEFERLLQDKHVRYVHYAPPCGTFSRAREIPIGWNLKKQGIKEPQPLRTTEYPHGIPRLAGIDGKRVHAANQLVEFMHKKH